jgi:hypothetical protein
VTVAPRPAIAAAMTEAQLPACVTDLARIRGWLVYHTHRSQHSEAGFPDLVLVGGRRLIFAELKTERGKVTRPQQTWLDALGVVESAVALEGPIVEVCLWRPADWLSGAIANVLKL